MKSIFYVGGNLDFTVYLLVRVVYFFSYIELTTLNRIRMSFQLQHVAYIVKARIMS